MAHYCEKCLREMLFGLAEAGVKIKRDAKKEGLYGIGIECERCFYMSRITYDVQPLSKEA